LIISKHLQLIAEYFRRKEIYSCQCFHCDSICGEFYQCTISEALSPSDIPNTRVPILSLGNKIGRNWPGKQINFPQLWQTHAGHFSQCAHYHHQYCSAPSWCYAKQAKPFPLGHFSLSLSLFCWVLARASKRALVYVLMPSFILSSRTHDIIIRYAFWVPRDRPLPIYSYNNYPVRSADRTTVLVLIKVDQRH